LISASSAGFTVGYASPSPYPTVSPRPNTGDTYAALAYTGTGADTTFSGTSGKGANGICQTFTVPQNAVLTMNVNEGGYESSIAYGDQEAYLFMGGASALTAESSPIQLFSELNTQSYSQTPADVGNWTERGPYTLTGTNGLGLTAGQTVTLFIGTYDNGPSTHYGEYILIDDVSVLGIPLPAGTAKARPPMKVRSFK